MSFNEGSSSKVFFDKLLNPIASRITIVDRPGNFIEFARIPWGIGSYLEVALQKLLDYVANRGGTELRVHCEVAGKRPTFVNVYLIDNGPVFEQAELEKRSSLPYELRVASRSLEGELLVRTSKSKNEFLMSIPFDMPMDWVSERFR